MIYHLLITLVLISFSVATNASATPMDAGNAMPGAMQHADLHQDVALVQGGRIDKDVANDQRVICPEGTQCDGAVVHKAKAPVAKGWMLVDDSSSALQPLAVLLLIIGSIVFFLSRKSASTK